MEKRMVQQLAPIYMRLGDIRRIADVTFDPVKSWAILSITGYGVVGKYSKR
jgi:hypothetical protein